MECGNSNKILCEIIHLFCESKYDAFPKEQKQESRQLFVVYSIMLQLMFVALFSFFYVISWFNLTLKNSTLTMSLFHSDSFYVFCYFFLLIFFFVYFWFSATRSPQMEPNNCVLIEFSLLLRIVSLFARIRMFVRCGFCSATIVSALHENFHLFMFSTKLTNNPLNLCVFRILFQNSFYSHWFFVSLHLIMHYAMRRFSWFARWSLAKCFEFCAW